MTLPIVILSLKRSADRVAVLKQELAALDLPSRIVEGPDAAELDARDLERQFGASVGRGASPATPGDMACTLGHLSIWRQIAESRAPAAVVLEDDARLLPGFRDCCTEETGRLLEGQGSGLLRLETRPGERLFGAPVRPGLWRLSSAAFGSAGYVVTREGAARLAARFETPKRPVDHLLFGPFSPARRLLRPLVLRPAVVAQDTARFPSLIADERDRLNTRRKTWRDRAARVAVRMAVATGRAEAIDEEPSDATLRPVNEPGTSL